MTDVLRRAVAGLDVDACEADAPPGSGDVGGDTRFTSESSPDIVSDRTVLKGERSRVGIETPFRGRPRLGTWRR